MHRNIYIGSLEFREGEKGGGRNCIFSIVICVWIMQILINIMLTPYEFIYMTYKCIFLINAKWIFGTKLRILIFRNSTRIINVRIINV